MHRVTPLSPTQAGALAKWCSEAGVPFVMGPLNGGAPWPRAFGAVRRAEREWLSYIRGVYPVLTGRNRMMEAGTAIIAGSRHAAAELGNWRDKTIWLPENAVDLRRFPICLTRRQDGPLRACFIGRMVPYKGPDMLLDAARPLIHEGRLTLDMIGDGPMMADLRRKAAPMGDGVRMHGWLPQEKIGEVAGQCSLLAFPSVREFGGGVIVEAMAMGLAPLIVDYAGPGELVSQDTGYKVALGDRDAIVAAFRKALTRLADDPDGVAATGARARDRVRRNFTWDAKARQVAEVYDWVLGGRQVKPDFSGIVRAGYADKEMKDVDG